MSRAFSAAENYVEEAAHLWILRRHMWDQPHFDLDDLTELDERILAQLDGLRALDKWGREAAREAYEAYEEAGELFVYVNLGMDTPTELDLQDMLTNQEQVTTCAHAIHWRPHRAVASALEHMLRSEYAMVREAAVLANGLFRIPPQITQLQDEHPGVVYETIRAAGLCGQAAFIPALHGLLQDAKLGREAARALTLLGDAKGRAALIDVVAAQNTDEDLGLAVMSADETQRARLMRIPSPRHQLQVAGFAGDLTAIPQILTSLRDQELSRMAGWAFTMITGLDLEEPPFEAEPPTEPNAQTEEEEEADLALDLDENLPWPNPEAVTQWWSEHLSQFSQDTRYVLGQPRSDKAWKTCLAEARQPARILAATALALAEPSATFYPVESPGFRKHE